MSDPRARTPMTGAASTGPRPEWAPRPTAPSTVWTVAKWLVLVGYLTLVIALFITPDSAARLFWNVLVPIVPAALLINVELWRNVCPLATLNAIRGTDDEGQPMSKQAIRVATAIGITVLLVCLPLRKAVLNDNGAATALLLAGVGVMALASGLRYRRKAGFCNSVCPILPIERLYGARPMVVVENARCTPCRACTRSGCIDLGTERSVLQVMGDAARSRTWITTPFGAFALAFPGIVAAFYMMPPTQSGDFLGAALAIGLGGAASWLLIGVMVTLRPLGPTRSLVWVAALAAGLYYWFTAASTAEAFGFPGASAVVLRVAAFALILAWLTRALRSPTELVSIAVPSR